MFLWTFALIDVIICFMKQNILTIVLSLVIFTALAGCSGKAAAGDNSQNESESAPVIREVDNLPDADITIPSGLVGTEITDIMDQSSANYSERDNQDGTITYSLSGNDRKEIVNNISNEIMASIKEILDNDEYYPDITDITPNEDCTCFTIEVNNKEMNLYESMLTMSFYTAGNKYQIYNGVDAKDAKTVVIYQASDTGEIISQSDSSAMDTFTSAE